MPSNSCNNRAGQAFLTLESIADAIDKLIEWNNSIHEHDDYYSTQHGMQLLAASCTLLTAIGEGINRICRITPGFLETNFPATPWHAIVGLRNHIAHGYFELDSEIIFSTVKTDIPKLKDTIAMAKCLCRDISCS